MLRMLPKRRANKRKRSEASVEREESRERERSLGIWLLENETKENKTMGMDTAALRKVTEAEIISPRKAVLRDQVEVAMLAAGGIQ